MSKPALAKIARSGPDTGNLPQGENWHTCPTMRDERADIHPLLQNAPGTTEFKKLRKRIIRQMREAIDQYGMIERGARWLVCLSGGKDSYPLLAALYELKWRGLLPVDLLACNLDQGQPGFPATILPEFLTRMQVDHRIEYQDTYSIVVDKIPEGQPIAPCARGSGAGICIGLRAKRVAAPSCWAITATISSKRFS